MDPGGSIAQGEASPRGLSQGHPRRYQQRLPSFLGGLCSRAIFEGFSDCVVLALKIAPRVS